VPVPPAPEATTTAGADDNDVLRALSFSNFCSSMAFLRANYAMT